MQSGIASPSALRRIRRLAAPANLWRTYLALALGVVAVLYLAGSPQLRTWSLPLAAACGAGGLAFGAWRNRAAQAGSWYGLALALLLLGLGDLARVLAGTPGSTAGAPTADALYFSGYAAAIVALGSLAWARGAGTDVDALIDTGIASLGVGLVAWIFLIRPAASQAPDLPSSAAAVSYPLLDVALGIVLVAMLVSPQRSRSLLLLLVALAVFLVSDGLYLRATIDGTYVPGGPADSGWFVGYVMWGAGSLHPTSRFLGRFGALRAGRGQLSVFRPIVVVGSCLIAPLLLMVTWATGRTADLPLIALAGIALTLLWAARLGLTIRRLRGALDDREQLEWRLREQAERDALLGLLNRASFLSRLRATLAAGQAVAVLYVDLDNFKVINDTYGHAAGDAALIEVARRVEGLLRPPDIAARIGGDEFGVLLPAADALSAEAVASRLLARLERPVTFEGRDMLVRASVGVSRGGPEKLADDLIREADVAMYLAKSKGKNRHVLFEAATHADAMRRIQLRAELERAVELGQFTVQYQPIVSMPGGVVRDCEALIRWQHPMRGLLSPDEFIDLAEETGVIVELGLWLLNEASREALRWHDELGAAAPGVAINVSALQVRRPDFASTVASVLGHSGLDPRRLIVEITESTLIEVESATSVVADLSRAGVRIAIDDFGTGYSALSYLTTYPVDLLKIDRSFVASLHSGPREARLVSAIVALGKDLGLQVIAEGVETETQLNALAGHGCTSFQGFLFARPMTGPDLLPLLVDAARRHEPFARELRTLRRSA